MARHALLALALLAAVLSPAAAADCSFTVTKAMSLCKSQMVDIVLAAQAGFKPDAASLAPSQACCAAAAAVFDPVFMSSCGCDAAVLQSAVTTTRAALDVLKQMVGDVCKPAGELADFPVCPAAAVAAAAKAAGVTYNLANDGSLILASANGTGNGTVTPKAGNGSKCYVTKACSSRCNGTTASAAKAYANALLKCRTTTAKGYCADGYSVCGNNDTDNAEHFTKTDARTGKTVDCFKCCQPGGE